MKWKNLHSVFLQSVERRDVDYRSHFHLGIIISLEFVSFFLCVNTRKVQDIVWRWGRQAKMEVKQPWWNLVASELLELWLLGGMWFLNILPELFGFQKYSKLFCAIPKKLMTIYGGMAAIEVTVIVVAAMLVWYCCWVGDNKGGGI